MSAAKERPILFRGPMVRAILAGRKTQTRRLVRPQPSDGVRHSPFCPSGIEDAHGRALRPICFPGDRLWVKETHVRWTGCGPYGAPSTWVKHPDRAPYQERGYVGDPEVDAIRAAAACVTVPSIHMPRWASRITLEVTEVRVQRLHEIREEDACAEGVDLHPEPSATTPYRSAFIRTWEANSGKRASWSSNPWVWAITFRRVPA